MLLRDPAMMTRVGKLTFYQNFVINVVIIDFLNFQNLMSTHQHQFHFFHFVNIHFILTVQFKFINTFDSLF